VGQGSFQCALMLARAWRRIVSLLAAIGVDMVIGLDVAIQCEHDVKVS
jgi:hypothetical protein